MISTIFNGPFTSRAQLDVKGDIPPALFKYLRSLLSANPKARTSFSKLIKDASEKNGYFDDVFLTASLFLEQFALKGKEEKEQFLLTIEKTVESFPILFCKYKVLPELVQSLEFGGAGAKALKPILTIGSRLSDSDFDELLTPTIIKLFASSDRSIRLALCEKLDLYINHLSSETTNQTIYPNLASGFNDTTAVIREQTLKAVAAIAPKLDTKTINNSLLRYLAKLQTDPEPGIRTNTTICLVKLSKYFDQNVLYSIDSRRRAKY